MRRFVVSGTPAFSKFQRDGSTSAGDLSAEEANVLATNTKNLER